jgi:FlaA1/EpsC-like NDP-sugar epimerase
MGKGGETFFLDMGEPLRIGDLAENMIRLSGFEPGRDIPIEVVGLRPGERLTETLVMDGEKLLPTQHEKVFAVENHRLDVETFQRDYETLKQLVLARDHDGAVEQLKAMAERY